MLTPTFYTKDNLAIYTRPITAADTPYLVDIFTHMSSESRYHRFHQTVDHLTEAHVWQEAEGIATADPATQFGLLAFIEWPHEPAQPIAGARYVKLNEEDAEIAISVRDDYHGRGVGTQLMALIAEEAKARGIKRLVADIQNDNQAVWAVLSKLPYPIHRSPEGAESHIEIELIGNEQRA